MFTIVLIVFFATFIILISVFSHTATAREDTYISDVYRNENYGNEDLLLVGHSEFGIYLLFDSDPEINYLYAHLYLPFQNVTEDLDLRAYIIKDNWNEMSLTCDNLLHIWEEIPKINFTITAANPNAIIDITLYFNDLKSSYYDSLSILIVPVSEGSAILFSKEHDSNIEKKPYIKWVFSPFYIDFSFLHDVAIFIFLYLLFMGGLILFGSFWERNKKKPIHFSKTKNNSESILILNKERIQEFRESIKRGGNIPYYISAFLDQNKSKIINGEDITYGDWLEYIKKNEKIRASLKLPKRNTFVNYRNLWFHINFEKSYQDYFKKQPFTGENPYFRISPDGKDFISFPQVSRILISSYIYSQLIIGIEENNLLLDNVMNFFLENDYKLSDDYIKFFDYYSSRESRKRSSIEDDEFQTLKELLGDPNYEAAFRNYSNTLIKLVKKLYLLTELPESEMKGISPLNLKRELGLNFSRNELTELINFLTKRYDLNFYFSRKELYWLSENGINTKSVKKTRSRWYWIKEEKCFKHTITEEAKTGTELALEFFKLFVIPPFKISGKKPTAKNFRETKYRYLYEQLKSLKSHNELLKIAGLKPVHEYPYKDMTFSELKGYFNEEIYPFLKKLKNLKRDIAPLAEDVMKYYRGFINKIYENPDKTYIDFVKELNLKPQQDIRVEAGILMHEIIRYITSYSYKKYYTEISLYEPVRNLTVDGLLINDKRFIQLINDYIPSILNLLKNKRFILFDYTVIFNDNGNLIKSRIAERIIKYMRNVSKEALFVIGTRWNYSKSTYKLPAIIKHKKKNISTNNTYLISPEVFASLLQIKGKFLNIYRNALQCHTELNIRELKEILKELTNNEDIKILSSDDLRRELNVHSLIEIFDFWYTSY